MEGFRFAPEEIAQAIYAYAEKKYNGQNVHPFIFLDAQKLSVGPNVLSKYIIKGNETSQDILYWGDSVNMLSIIFDHRVDPDVGRSGFARVRLRWFGLLAR